MGRGDRHHKLIGLNLVGIQVHAHGVDLHVGGVDAVIVLVEAIVATEDGVDTVAVVNLEDVNQLDGIGATTRDGETIRTHTQQSVYLTNVDAVVGGASCHHQAACN